MKNSDDKKFKELMMLLYANHEKEINGSLTAQYWLAFAEMSIEDFEVLIGESIREDKWWPKIPDLRERAGLTMKKGDKQAAAAFAWDTFARATARHGAYESVEFADPIITAVCRNLGGWQKLCLQDSEEFNKWTRKDFERIYIAYASNPAMLSAEATAPLVGIHEQRARLAGWDEEMKPRIVGGHGQKQLTRKTENGDSEGGIDG